MGYKQDTACELFNSGFNCSQSVLTAFCEKYGLDRETALKAACGLGGGCRSGEICGAVSGAVITIGLKYGHCQPGDVETKTNCYAKTAEFLNAFKAKNGSIICREILNCDISTKEGMEEAKSKNLFKTTCVDMVRSAASILEELGY
jgi:C_GCAxxG_C_C family probable redox protein